MKRLLLLSVIVAVCNTLAAQDSICVESVVMERHCFMNKFYVDSCKVSLNRMIAGCGANEPAADMFGKAQESKVFGAVFCFTGACLVAYPLISCIWEDKPNVPMAVAGCCMAAISVPLFINYNRQSKEALRLMGEEYIPPKEDEESMSLNVGLSPAGFGLCLKF